MREIWITGIGLVTSLGEGPDGNWQALTVAEPRPQLDAESFAPYTVHPLPALELDRQIPKKGDQRQMEPWQRLGTYAAGLAIDSAGARDPALLGRTHLVVAAGGGERDVALDQDVAAELARLPVEQVGPRLNELLGTGLRPTLFLAQLSNLLAGNISIVHGVTGSSRTLMGEENAAADAVRVAQARLAEGRGEIALVGGAFIASRWDLLLLYGAGGMLGRTPWAPISAREQGGSHLGSMAAFLVLESAEHARARGARGLARLTAVATDAARRRGEDTAEASARRLAARVAPAIGAGRLGILSGMTGSAATHAGEEAFIATLAAPHIAAREVALRRLGSVLGHGVEANFPVGLALGALALSRDGFFAPFDPADTPGQEAVDQVLVTGFGQWRGEALALLDRVPPDANKGEGAA